MNTSLGRRQKEKVPLFLAVTAIHLKHFLEISQMCFRSQLYICNVTSSEYFYLLPKLVFIAVSGARASVLVSPSAVAPVAPPTGSVASIAAPAAKAATVVSAKPTVPPAEGAAVARPGSGAHAEAGPAAGAAPGGPRVAVAAARAPVHGEAPVVAARSS